VFSNFRGVKKGKAVAVRSLTLLQ